MTWEIGLYIAAGFIASSVVFYLFTIVYASYRIYTETLSRRTPDQWGRVVSSDDERALKMDAEGMKWHEENLACKQDVHIVSGGLNLYGEYYDFGNDKAVMILSGRTESLRYGYYFAQSYYKLGFNVLVIDPRAHGLSDGKYNTVGFEESKDALNWAKFLHENYKVKSIVFHGICIGAAGGMLAITSPECPDYITALVTEGMFPRFGESMKNHLIERKKLLFPIVQCIDFWMKHYTGHSMMTGPINFIPGMNKPLLMLQSKMDKYSTVHYAKQMFELCPSKEKRLVLFEQGDHSMLRITDTEKYDTEIAAFINNLFQPAMDGSDKI